MFYDGTNAFIGPKSRNSGFEIETTSTYNRRHITLLSMYREVYEMAELYLNRYANYLSELDSSKAWGIFYGCCDAREYRHFFLTNVLMDSYRVFDESHARYTELLNVVAANNPEWMSLIIKDHDEKIKRCKAKVYS